MEFFKIPVVSGPVLGQFTNSMPAFTPSLGHPRPCLHGDTDSLHPLTSPETYHPGPMYGGLKRGCLCLRFVPQSLEANCARDKEMTRKGPATSLPILFLPLCPTVTLPFIKGCS